MVRDDAGVIFAVLQLLITAAAALPAAPEPEAIESTEALRRLQAGGACQGMMLEMQPIAASCCGSNMVRVPSQTALD